MTPQTKTTPRASKNHEERIERLRALLSKKRLDAAVLFSGESHNDLSSKSTYYLSTLSTK